LGGLSHISFFQEKKIEISQIIDFKNRIFSFPSYGLAGEANFFGLIQVLMAQIFKFLFKGDLNISFLFNFFFKSSKYDLALL